MIWLGRAIGLQLALALVSLAGLAVDARQLMGVNTWLKPLKFQLSFFVYLWTLRWMLGYYPPGHRLSEWMARAAAFLISGEVLLITLQGARGVQSHFNGATALDRQILNAMGTLIFVLGGVMLAMTLLYWFRPPQHPLLGAGTLAGMRWGLVLLLAGGAEAFLMLAQDAHSVGGVDGGAGLPLVNWSVDHGDLRVAHLVGLHGLQVLPLAGWLVDRLRWPAMLASAAAVAYAGGFVWFLRQALAGSPVL